MQGFRVTDNIMDKSFRFRGFSYTFVEYRYIIGAELLNVKQKTGEKSENSRKFSAAPCLTDGRICRDSLDRIYRSVYLNLDNEELNSKGEEADWPGGGEQENG